MGVTVFLAGLHGAEHDGMLAADSKDHLCRDDVPAILRDDIGGEEVDLLECVVLFLVVVGLELAEVSGAGAVACGLDLDAEDAAAGFHSDVEGRGVSPWLGDFVAMEHGFGHETEFGPLAAFFVSLENFEFVHVCWFLFWLAGYCSERRARMSSPGADPPARFGGLKLRQILDAKKKKAQPVGRAFYTEIFFALYFQNSILSWVIRTFSRIYIPHGKNGLGEKGRVLPLDKSFPESGNCDSLGAFR